MVELMTKEMLEKLTEKFSNALSRLAKGEDENLLQKSSSNTSLNANLTRALPYLKSSNSIKAQTP